MRRRKKSLQSILIDGLFKMSVAGVLYGIAAMLVYIIV